MSRPVFDRTPIGAVCGGTLPVGMRHQSLVELMENNRTARDAHEEERRRQIAEARKRPRNAAAEKK